MALIVQPQRWDAAYEDGRRALMTESPDGDYVLFDDAVAWVEHTKAQDHSLSGTPAPRSTLAELEGKVTALEKAWYECDALRAKLEERISELTKIKRAQAAEIRHLHGELAEAKQSLHDKAASLLLNPECLRDLIGPSSVSDPMSMRATKAAIRHAFPQEWERGEVTPEKMYRAILERVAAYARARRR